MIFDSAESEFIELHENLEFTVLTGGKESDLGCKVVSLWSGNKNITERLGYGNDSIELSGYGHLAQLLYLAKLDYPIRFEGNQALKETGSTASAIIDAFTRDLENRRGLKWVLTSLTLEESHGMLSGAFEEVLDLLNSGLKPEELVNALSKCLIERILNHPLFAECWFEVTDEIKLEHFRQTTEMVSEHF